MNLKIFELTVPDNAFRLEEDGYRTRTGPAYTCKLNPDHGGKQVRDGMLFVILPHLRLPDFMGTWMSNYLVNEKTAELIKNSNLTGVMLDDVVISKVDKDDIPESNYPKLFEINHQGWGGLASQESGIRLLSNCPGCEDIEFSPLKKPKYLFDEKQWDGSDFFVIWPLMKYIFVTERVKMYFERENITGAEFIPIEKLELSGNNLRPGPMHYKFGRDRAKLLSGLLGIK